MRPNTARSTTASADEDQASGLRFLWPFPFPFAIRTPIPLNAARDTWAPPLVRARAPRVHDNCRTAGDNPRHGQRPRPAPAQDRPPRPPRRLAPAGTLIELARERKVALPSETPEGLEALVFRPRYANLAEYLEGFQYTVGGPAGRGGPRAGGLRAGRGLPGRGRALPRGALRPPAPRAPGLRGARRGPGRRPRPAPRGRGLQPPARGRSGPGAPVRRRHHPLRHALLHARVLARLPALLRGPARGLRARDPRRRRASRWRAPRRGCGARRACSWSGSTSPARRRATRRRTTREAYQVAHEAFLGKTVHAGEDYGPGVDLPGDRRPARRPHRPRHLALRRDQDHEPAHPATASATSRTSRSSSPTSASRSRSA